MTYRFHEEAETEFLESIEYYESCNKGLGLDFSHEVHDAIKRILAFPYAWQMMSENTRRCLVNRFPYSIKIRY